MQGLLHTITSDRAHSGIGEGFVYQRVLVAIDDFEISSGEQ
ncbi:MULTISPECIES: hypothetical protein [unclassified Microcoleus]